ncbi:hypothetical protein CYMTET_14279 [Cymbomonas tetramitiformis]|uniref:Uncharacterized protein n=1 Tax=Cymbomonas tetramitiformis TaxID=36881 RepID=A0AAE0LA08_9CHLO|nr:hypothetical protein CYMTET_14279 [Cymbomonas tetramitiformis]
MPRTKEECRSMMQSIISMHENGAVADPKASAKLAKRGDADDLERRLLHKKSCWLDLEAVADVEDATVKMDEVSDHDRARWNFESGSNVDGDVNQHQHPTHRSDVVKRKREVALLRCDAEEKRLKLAMVKMDTAASPSGDKKQFQDWLEERYEPILLPPTERSDALRVSDIRIAFDEWVTDFDARFKNDRECEKALKLAKVDISPQARLYKNRNTRIRKLVFLKRRENCCAFGKAVDDGLSLASP